MFNSSGDGLISLLFLVWKSGEKKFLLGMEKKISFCLFNSAQTCEFILLQIDADFVKEKKKRSARVVRARLKCLNLLLPKCKNLFSPYRKCKAIALNSQRNCLGASFSLALFKITVYGNKKHKTWDESSSARLSQLQIDLATQAYTIFDGNYFGRKKKYKIKQFMHFLPIRRWTRKFRNVKKLFPFCCVASFFAQVWANRKKNS